MATPARNQAPRRARFGRRGEIAVALALLGILVAWLPRPSHARLRGARSAAQPAPPVERALTGGLVTLRAPGSRMIRVTKSEFVMGSSSDDVLAALASCAGEPLGHLCDEKTF